VEEDQDVILIAAEFEIRHKILSFLGEKRRATAKEMQAATGKPRSTVNEHLRRLHEVGLIKCVEKNAKRGAFERVYAPAPGYLFAGDDEVNAMGPKAEKQIAFRQLRSLLGDASSALSRVGLLQRRGNVFSSARARVDLEGWQELAAIHTRALEEMERVRRESDERLRETGGKAIRASSGIFLFEIPERPTDP
jgi:DNA-binding transcriptional ArsR family regulator